MIYMVVSGQYGECNHDGMYEGPDCSEVQIASFEAEADSLFKTLHGEYKTYKTKERLHKRAPKKNPAPEPEYEHIWLECLDRVLVAAGFKRIEYKYINGTWLK